MRVAGVAYGSFRGDASREQRIRGIAGRVFGNYTSTGCRQVRQWYSSSNYDSYWIPTNLVNVVVTDEVKIDYGAFQNCEDLRSVTILDGVTDIGSYAFQGCSSLEDVVLPDTVVSVGSYAFQNCKSLSAEALASFPTSLKTVGSYAFSGCERALGEVVIPEGVEVIGSYAFQNCYNVTNVTISSTVTNIGQCAFQDCRSLRSLVIPDNVLYIGYGAFGGCASLESLTIPFVGARRGNDGTSEALFGNMFGSNTSTGGRMIRQYYVSSSGYGYSNNYYIPTNLAEVVVTDETKIGYGAFYGCEDLRSVTIGEGVATIGTSAFYGCLRLEDVEIPDSMVSIDGTAFSGCASLMYDTASISGLKLLDGWVSGYTAELTGKLDLTNVRGIIAGDISGTVRG